MNANRKPRLGVEPLEDRSLAAGLTLNDIGHVPDLSVTATLSLGVLRVNGTILADSIQVKQANGVITVFGVAGYFPAAAVNRIEVNGYGNDDVIRLNSETMPGGQPILKPCIVHGGSGHDFIFGGYGNDQLHGDGGDDAIFGGAGHDTLIGGSGRDSMYGGAGNDRITADTADAIASGQAGTDVTLFERVDPAVLVNYDASAMKSALQVGLTGVSFSKKKDGEKVTISKIEVQSVTIENGVTTLHLKARIRYQKTTGFPQFSTTGTIKFSVQPKLNATFVENQVHSASVKLANPNVNEVNINNVPNWLDNTSEVRSFLENKLENLSPLPVTSLLQLFIQSGGSLGPTVTA
jgi:hypothetical protein